VVEQVRRHLAGDLAALGRTAPAGLDLDLEGVPPFHRRVYEALRGVPAGATVTYGELAALAGAPGASRAVGQAMAKNPVPILVPCHRVLAAGGAAGGFSAAGGLELKARLLELEGVTMRTGPMLKLAFDADEATRMLSAADRRLARVIARSVPFRLSRPPPGDTFDALLRAIVYQQLSGKAAATILGRVRALHAGALTPEAVLGTKDATFRAAGLSGSKTLAVKDLARRVADGKVPSLARLRKMDDEAIIETLTEVRGVGRWTVEMLLMFRLGRPDVLPVGDFGVGKGFELAYGGSRMPSRDELARRAEKWRPFRSVGSWYMWRAVDLSRAGRL